MNAGPDELPVTTQLLATVWPRTLPSDSEAQRRKKTVVRSAQVAVAVMVAAGVAGAIVADSAIFSAGRIAALVLAAAAYTAWSLNGMRKPVQVLLAVDAAEATPAANIRTVIYFIVQLVLAGIVFHLSNHTRGGALAWLVLLPPVAHSVILLPRAGIATVALVVMAMLALNVLAQQGPRFVLSASIAFSFAVFFTLIFTVLAVSAERSRHKIQRLADELASANRKLREYAVEAEELAATRERNRLAREIHDSLGHYLTVVNVQIEAARAMHERDSARSRAALDKAQSLTQQGLQEIRRSVAALRALPLENQSLPAALGHIVEESRAAGLEVTFELLGAPRKIAPAAELTLYRAAQEGLTNVRKHATTATASVRLSFDHPAIVSLSVSDKGAGTAALDIGSHGFGLIGLRERAQLLGGRFQVETAPGNGFTLRVEVPG